MLDVNTNLGNMPLVDYLHIKTIEYGFDNYEELLKNGYHIGIYTKDYYNKLKEQELWQTHKKTI